MTGQLASDDRAALEEIVRGLEAAWNAADGDAFAAPFVSNAHFVTVRGEHLRGRDAIAVGHAGIFQTIYAGSVNRYTIESAQLLRAEVALVHVHARLDVPGGPLAGRQGARFSLVLTKEPAGWEIVALHNTMEAAAG